MKFFFFICFYLSVAPVFSAEDFIDLERVKERVITSLLPTLQGEWQSEPLLVLIGGYVGSGKSTLSQILKERFGMTVFSLNAIRQAMLDDGIDIRKNKQEEREILFDVYPKLFKTCLDNCQHIVVDANANRQGIQEALKWLEMSPKRAKYRLIKICLQASEEKLFQRVSARVPSPGLHQGTIEDLAYELKTPTKAIYPEDYDLVINTEMTSLEEEIKILEGIIFSILPRS